MRVALSRPPLGAAAARRHGLGAGARRPLTASAGRSCASPSHGLRWAPVRVALSRPPLGAAARRPLTASAGRSCCASPWAGRRCASPSPRPSPTRGSGRRVSNVSRWESIPQYASVSRGQSCCATAASQRYDCRANSLGALTCSAAWRLQIEATASNPAVRAGLLLRRGSPRNRARWDTPPGSRALTLRSCTHRRTHTSACTRRALHKS